MIKSPLPILLSVFFMSTAASAELAGGLVLDTSSNMLQRPDGESGTLAMLYASYDRQVTRRIFVMYGVEGDFSNITKASSTIVMNSRRCTIL